MRAPARSGEDTLRRVTFLLVLLPLLVAFPYVRALNNPNEMVRVFTVMALVENGTYVIDEQVAIFGWSEDMARVRGEDGAEHQVMVKAPGIVYAGVPAYALYSKIVAPLLGRRYPGPAATSGLDEATTREARLSWLRASTWAMRLVASQLPCFLFLIWFERWLRAFSTDAVLRLVAVVAAGLGTNMLAYAHMFASHTAYAIVAFLAFAVLERELRRSQEDRQRARPRAAALAGFLTSACVTLEYQALFMTLVLAAFALWVFGRDGSWRARAVGVGAFAGGGLLNVPHMMWFHLRAYGNPFTPGHQQLENARFAAEHKTGLWGVSWPTLDALGALAFDPGFGFFGTSPFMLLGLASVPLLLLSPSGPGAERRRLRLITVVWASCMAVVVGVNAGFVEWRAGWTVGPRYLVVCAPFFAFGALLALERFAGASPARRALARGAGAGLALASVVAIGTVGLLVDTLPDTIRRPFAQFFVPMVKVGLVPHDLGEWVGSGGVLWYVALAALLLSPALLAVWGRARRRHLALRLGAFLTAAALGVVPALTPPADGSPMFVLHSSTVWFATSWEPPRHDRAATLRDEAQRTAQK